MNENERLAELKRRLEHEHAPLPPATLLERLKNDIPDPITLQRSRGDAPSTLWGVWQIAASVLVVITGAFAALWIGNEMVREQSLSVATLDQKAPYSEAVRAEGLAEKDQQFASSPSAEVSIADVRTENVVGQSDAVKPSLSRTSSDEAGLESELAFAPEKKSKEDAESFGDDRGTTTGRVLVAESSPPGQVRPPAEETTVSGKLADRDEKRKDQARPAPAAAPRVAAASELAPAAKALGGSRQSSMLDDLRRTLEAGSMPDPKTIRTEDLIWSVMPSIPESGLPDTESASSPFSGSTTTYTLVRRGSLSAELDQQAVSRYRMSGSDSSNAPASSGPSRLQTTPVLIEAERASLKQKPTDALRKNEVAKVQEKAVASPERWEETSRSFRVVVLTARLAAGLQGRLTHSEIVELQRILRQESEKAPADANLIRLRDLTASLERIAR